MNYLETGLPHTEFYKRKSDFVPPRYKPLCGLGRRYLGLEPVSKSELKCVINRLCQPKKSPEPEDRPKSALEVRPGTGRFNGGKRMTGNQINNMVDRLTRRKTDSETKPVKNDNKKKENKPILKFRERKRIIRFADKNKENEEGNTAEVKTEVEEIVNTKGDNEEQSSSDTEVGGKRRESDNASLGGDRDETNADDNLNHFQRIEEKMLAYLKAKQERDKAEKENLILEQYKTGSTTFNIEHESKDRKSKQSVEERSYGSLYYRGVKTEIARKFYNDTVGRTSRSDSIKSSKAVVIVSPKSTRRNSRVDTLDNIRQKQRSKTT